MEEDTRRDKIIDAIFFAQPATTWEEIAASINSSTDLNVTRKSVELSVLHLRKHCRHYGWTIPHLKRGIPSRKDGSRIFAVLVDGDGHYCFDADPSLWGHVRRGRISTLRTAYSLLVNVSNVLQSIVKHTRKRSTKALLLEVSETIEFLARRCIKLAERDEVDEGREDAA